LSHNFVRINFEFFKELRRSASALISAVIDLSSEIPENCVGWLKLADTIHLLCSADKR